MPDRSGVGIGPGRRRPRRRAAPAAHARRPRLPSSRPRAGPSRPRSPSSAPAPDRDARRSTAAARASASEPERTAVRLVAASVVTGRTGVPAGVGRVVIEERAPGRRRRRASRQGGGGPAPAGERHGDRRRPRPPPRLGPARAAAARRAGQPTRRPRPGWRELALDRRRQRPVPGELRARQGRAPWSFEVVGVPDDYGTWLRDLRLRFDDGQDVALELEEGALHGRPRAWRAAVWAPPIAPRSTALARALRGARPPRAPGSAPPNGRRRWR